MDLQVLKDQIGYLEIYPSVLVSSATVEVFRPDGTTLVASTAATVDTASTTLTGAASGNPNILHASDVTGFVVGRRYLITSQDGPEFLCTISAIDTGNDHIHVNVPPPFDIQNGDTLKGARVSYNLPADKTTKLDTFYRAEFTCTTAAEVFKNTVIFDVVRTQFRIADAEDVKKTITFLFPSAASRYEAGMLEEIAQRAARLVTDRVRATGRFPHLYGSPDLFQEAFRAAVRLILADHGLIPNAGNVDPIEYMTLYQDKLRDEIETATQGNAYDKNDDGEFTDEERFNWSTRIIL